MQEAEGKSWCKASSILVCNATRLAIGPGDKCLGGGGGGMHTDSDTAHCRKKIKSNQVTKGKAAHS